MTRTGTAGSTCNCWLEDIQAGPELVRSLMRELGLEPCQPRPWRVSLTEGDGQEHDIPDLVHRDFTAAAPGEKMVGDITYISTWEGWLYLATVIDCHTKAVIGWARADNTRPRYVRAGRRSGRPRLPARRESLSFTPPAAAIIHLPVATTLSSMIVASPSAAPGIFYDILDRRAPSSRLRKQRGPTLPTCGQRGEVHRILVQSKPRSPDREPAPQAHPRRVPGSDRSVIRKSAGRKSRADQNLGTGTYRTYNGMISGYRCTTRDVLDASPTTSGEVVSGSFLAHEADGTKEAIQRFAFRYVVHSGVIVSGHASLVSGSPPPGC